MNKNITAAALLIFVASMTGISCKSAGDRPTTVSQDAGENTRELSVEEQDKMALEVFQKVFTLIEDSSREAVLPQMEALYLDLIQKYPKAKLAQESYWRLALMYTNDFNPPAYEKIEGLYGRFISLYPDSQFRAEIDDAISNCYSRNGKWESLEKFYAPVIRQYIETGILSRPQDMYRYGEAKRHLGDLAEAEKAFRIVISMFPRSRESALSKMKLEEVKKIKYKQ